MRGLHESFLSASGDGSLFHGSLRDMQETLPVHRASASGELKGNADLNLLCLVVLLLAVFAIVYSSLGKKKDIGVEGRDYLECPHCGNPANMVVQDGAFKHYIHSFGHYNYVCKVWRGERKNK